MIPMPHEVSIIRSEGLDDWGNPIAVDPKEYRCFIRTQQERIQNVYGDEVISNYRIIFEGTVKVVAEDTIEFTEANDEPVSLKPQRIKYIHDIDGTVRYTRVMM